jgi:hypothetical protein
LIRFIFYLLTKFYENNGDKKNSKGRKKNFFFVKFIYSSSFPRLICLVNAV